MSEINPTLVSRYFEGVKTSILGPYMMDGYGFPNGAGDYRFKAETQIVKSLLNGVDRDGAVLDLGCGVGYWAEAFAQEFSSVVAVEGSANLYDTLATRCLPYPNIQSVHSNVLNFQPEGDFNLAFLGGLLMYLDESDVVALLGDLKKHLNPDGIILCRESTVRGDTLTLTGDYSVVYRSIETYRRIFESCGLAVRVIERNEPYVLLEMGCQLIGKWKALMPKPFQMLPLIGCLTYWGLRAMNPWILNVPKIFETPFPRLENHFFVLEAVDQTK
jgi:SAM-dependent methyltransferase